MRASAQGNIVIVLIFALLHFAVAVVSRMLDYYDDIPLTILTITMVIVVAMRNNARVEMMAIITFVVTLLGFLIGTWLWEPLSIIIGNQYLAPAISTFLLTTIFGLATDYITRRNKRFRSYNPTWRPSAGNIIIVAISILILRMAYVVMFRAGLFSEGVLLSNIIEILNNTWAILTIIGGNIIVTMRLSSHIQKRSSRRYRIVALLLIAAIIISIATSTLLYYDVPHFEYQRHNTTEFIQLFFSVLLIDLLVAMICVLFQLSMYSNRELRYEREQKHRSEYQYERLKQQINPHFLFNSLGILDYLVQEHETERASAFIRKLANIYRYMLSNDQKPLVKLSEEIEFTSMYIDLLKERFVEGMIIEIDVEPSMHNRYVVPCSLQLLVENATKHNIVSTDKPLRISITSDGDYIVVHNNLQKRTHGQPSTHLGLANIQQQYQDITHRDIDIEQSDSEFIVKLPIV